MGVSDGSGNFDIGLSNGTWEINPAAAPQLGIVSVSFADGTNLAVVNGAALSGKILKLKPVTGFVTGRARNGKTLAYLKGATLVASAPGTYEWAASAVSDQNGYWALGVAAGQWDVYAQLDTDNDLYKTMLYPSARYTKTISASQTAQSVGTIDFLPADSAVSVKVVDYQNQPQPDLYLYGCDQGITNSYESNAGSTDSNGQVSVPVRNDKTWFVGVNLEDGKIVPPQHRLDVLAADGNVIKIYPQGYRKRPYRVYGCNSLPGNINYPQDSGFALLGKATGTASFTGSYAYYCIVAYEGEVLIDSIRGFNGSYYGAASSAMTVNASRITGKPDGQYATVGDNSGAPAVGAVCIKPGTPLGGITVIHPDEPYNATQDWCLYDAPDEAAER
jgi:hypothetical protein